MAIKTDLKAEAKLQKIRDVRAQEHEVLAALKDTSYEALVSNVYSELDANVEMVLGGISYGFICEGKGGVGKTYRVLNMCLAKCGEDGVAYLDSFTTPASLYIWLYKNKDLDVCVVDDAAGFFANDKIKAFVKAATWPVANGKRVLSYLTTKPLQDEYGEYIPSTFEFESRLIVITNQIESDDPHTRAILSRINHVRVDMPRRELLRILEQVMKKEYKGLTEQERKDCYDFLVENTSNTTENLNIRTLLRVMDYCVYAKNHKKGDAWKMLSLKLLQQDDRMALVEKLITSDEFKSEEERFDRFNELTGESRATYYRLRGRLIKQQKEKAEAAALAEKQAERAKKKEQQKKDAE